MGQPMSAKSTVTAAQAAALFAVATSIRNNGQTELFGFADGVFRFGGRRRGQSVLKSVEAFTRRIGEVGYGTRIAEAVRTTYHKHDRVIIFTDMQTFPDHRRGQHTTGDVSAAVPAHIPVYGFNLAGYARSALPAGAGHRNRHELAGLTDHTFALIPLIEAGMAARWPWERDRA